VILYRCLSRTLPFTGATVLETLERIKTAEVPPLSDRIRGVPAELESICLRCVD
jgi:hypothetical protein